MTKLLALDLMDTLCKPASGESFPNSSTDLIPLRGTQQLIARYAAEGWTPVIVENQAGIEKGLVTIEYVIEMLRYAMSFFPTIKESYFCPDFAGTECIRLNGTVGEIRGYRNDWNGESFRKPGAGMIQLAAKLNEATEVLFVGNHDTDRKAAEAAGVKFLWIGEWLEQLLD